MRRSLFLLQLLSARLVVFLQLICSHSFGNSALSYDFDLLSAHLLGTPYFSCFGGRALWLAEGVRGEYPSGDRAPARGVRGESYRLSPDLCSLPGFTGGYLEFFGDSFFSSYDRDGAIGVRFSLDGSGVRVGDFSVGDFARGDRHGFGFLPDPRWSSGDGVGLISVSGHG